MVPFSLFLVIYGNKGNTVITRLHESRDFVRTCFAFKNENFVYENLFEYHRNSRWMERIIIICLIKILLVPLPIEFVRNWFWIYLKKNVSFCTYKGMIWSYISLDVIEIFIMLRRDGGQRRQYVKGYVKGEDVRRGFMNKKKETGTNAMHRRFVDRATIFIMGCRVICKHKITSRIAYTGPYCSRWLASISFEQLLEVENLSKWNI